MALFRKKVSNQVRNQGKNRDRQWTKCGSLTTTRQRLREWYENRPGHWLQDEEQQVLDTVLPDLFGYHLLQVGLSNRSDCMRASRIPHHLIMDVDLSQTEWPVPELVDTSQRPTRVQGTAEALPFASDSLDVLLLPHTLEFTSTPHEVLREADRVLIPEGHVVILGFNPWGLWMFWRMVLSWRGRPPWCGRFLRAARLRDWLQLLGFDIVDNHSYFFRPPLRQDAIMTKLRFLEAVGRRIWPIFGGAYVLVAKKRVATLTPVRPRWRPRRSRLASPELAGNSSVTNCQNPTDDQHGP
jgi:SAM-dependent methyltransferase